MTKTDISMRALATHLTKFDDQARPAWMYLKELFNLVKIKLNRQITIEYNLALEEQSYHRYKPFAQTYNREMGFQWEAYTNLKGYPQPREGEEWRYLNRNLLDHSNAITQSSNVTIEGDGYATQLLLLYKIYYDCHFVTSVYATEGKWGLMFRVKNLNNYMVFEAFKNETHGYKRIRRVVNGESLVISQVDDGGFRYNTWYTVMITMKKQEIQVYMME